MQSIYLEAFLQYIFQPARDLEKIFNSKKFKKYYFPIIEKVKQRVNLIDLFASPLSF